MTTKQNLKNAIKAYARAYHEVQSQVEDKIRYIGKIEEYPAEFESNLQNAKKLCHECMETLQRDFGVDFGIKLD